MAFLTELTAADSHPCVGHSAKTTTRLHLVQSDQVHPKLTLKQAISSWLRMAIMRSSLSHGKTQPRLHTLDGTAVRARALASVRFLGLSSMEQLLKLVEHPEFVKPLSV